MEGDKTIELRRVRPKVVPGSWALIYASSPQMCLVGAVELGEILEASPRALWKHVRCEAGISKADFDKYFVGAKAAYGIRIKRTVSLRFPIGLAALRHDSPNFRPPQSYAYLRSNDPSLKPLTQQLKLLQKKAA